MFNRVLNVDGKPEWVDPDKVIKAYTIQEGIVVVVLPEGEHIRLAEAEWNRLMAKANGEEE